MKRISIAGIDGSGKTTLITSLAKVYNETILYSPQTYKNPNLPLYELSKTIDLIGKWADQNQVAVIKGISLFLGMTLYRPLVEHIEKDQNPRQIIVERHPIIDTMAYAKFFLPMLNKELPANFIYQSLESIVTQEQLELVQKYIQQLTNSQGNSLTNLNYFIFNLLNNDQDIVFNNLITFYQIKPPDLYILLVLTPESIPDRFSDRDIVGAHENEKILSMLQHEMVKTCEYVKTNSANFNFKLIDARKSMSQVLLETYQLL